ncbi:MAG: hypothetical protein ABEI31_10620 [Halodesulfurarchaeum sp.]
MATPGEVPFAIDGQTLSSVKDATSGVAGPLGLETVLVVVGVAVVAVGILGVLSYLYAARDRVEDEIEEVAAEREAFLAFADRVEGMPASGGTTAMATPQTIHTFDNPGPPVRDVAAAFEETVMDLQHYTDTYGDDVIAQMSMEFDPDLVASLNGEGALSPTAKHSLKQAARDAAAKRENLLVILEREREQLARDESSLSDIVGELQGMCDQPLDAQSFSTLASRHERLGTLREEVAEIGAHRQDQIHETVRSLPAVDDEITLQEYLYRDIGGGSYPVLGSVARLDRIIGEARSRVRLALSSTA